MARLRRRRSHVFHPCSLKKVNPAKLPVKVTNIAAMPGTACSAPFVGAPLLAVGVWQERMGDIGFPITVLGLVLLGLTIELSSG